MLLSLQQPVLVSVIVPTLNEIDNIDLVLAAILAEAGDSIAFDILVADGGSTDGTIGRVREWEAVAKVRLVAGGGGKGLACDVLTAARAAKADIVLVLDADLSHPPARIRDLIKPVIDGTSDMAVGSRYVPGGATPGWPWQRRLLSRLGGLLAWPLTELKDPMSGFFAVRRQRLLELDPAAAGFKLGLEVIAQGGGALRVTEVPIVSRDRLHGQSKIGIGQMVAYMRRLLVLAGGAISPGSAGRFAAVGMIGMLVDLAAFEVFFGMGAALLAAHIGSFCIAAVCNYGLNSRWAFAPGCGAGQERSPAYFGRFLTVCLLALAIRGGVLAGAISLFALPPQIAILFAIGAAAIVSYLGSAFFVFPSINPRVPQHIRWRVAAIGVVAYVLVLRLLFLGLADLLPQEAYYWNYAHHLDIGYLDHPPMVAWLIWAGTGVFGDNEVGVRIGAYLGWFATAFFSFKLAQNMCGKSAAFVSLLLVATLPFFFASGLVITPDAPLTAAWAGALFFLERALVANKRHAWWGVGICIGLGMLSKYTISLLGPATLVFILADTRARAWLARPEPYLAAVLALLIFSPVIYWNLEHDWSSFAFQSSRRVAAPANFSFPALVLGVAALLTPLGLTAAAMALGRRGSPRREGGVPSPLRRHRRFIAIFTLVPLSVFVLFSLSHTVKLNWTGPLWLAVLPAISASILALAESRSSLELRVRRLWMPTVAVTLVMYGLGLNYLVLGFPGLGYLTPLPDVPIAWREFGREAMSIERDVELEAGAEPMLIGMDTYNLASQLAFYGNQTGEGVANSVGRGVLGKASLMYDYWFKPDAMLGRPAILFAFKRQQIDDGALDAQFASLSPVAERVITKNGRPAGHFYYRIGHRFQGLKGESAPQNQASADLQPGPQRVSNQ